MELCDKFRFGKYKDQALEDVLGSDRGRSWLAWWVDQPAQNPKFADVDRITKGKVRRHLTGESKRDPVPEQSREVHTMIDVYQKLCNLDNKIDIILAAIKPPTNEKAEETKEEGWEE